VISTGSEVTVVGAGGHAKVVIATLVAAGFRVRAAYDDTPEKWGRRLLGVPIQPREQMPRHLGSVVLAIGRNDARQRLAQELACEWITLVHPRAWVDPGVTLGPGTVVFAGAVIQPGASVGDHVIVNTAATIDHDCEIGSFAHLGPGCHLAGHVVVGEGALLGAGACARPRVRIGRWSTIGAGAAVVGDIPDERTAIGVPARVR
jgi:sugar O-acyltransferase (sialic acid O-acetyltransferase NeuD family)